MNARALAAVERLLAARVPIEFLEALAIRLEAPGAGGDTIRVAFHRNKGRLVDIVEGSEKRVPLTPQDARPHTTG